MPEEVAKVDFKKFAKWGQARFNIRPSGYYCMHCNTRETNAIRETINPLCNECDQALIQDVSCLNSHTGKYFLSKGYSSIVLNYGMDRFGNITDPGKIKNARRVE